MKTLPKSEFKAKMRPCIVVRPYSRKREVREVFGDLSGTLILHEDPDLPTMDEWSDELAASGALLEWTPRVSDWRGAAGGRRDSGGLAPQSATALGSHGAGATQPVAAQWRHALYTTKDRAKHLDAELPTNP